MKTVLAGILFASCSSAFALMGFLESESVNGMNRYCKYSNGVILTVSAVALCPLSVN